MVVSTLYHMCITAVIMQVLCLFVLLERYLEHLLGAECLRVAKAGHMIMAMSQVTKLAHGGELQQILFFLLPSGILLPEL